MNLEKYIKQKVKINVEQGDKILTYDATIISSNEDQTLFKDRFNKEILVPSSKIIFVEVVG